MSETERRAMVARHLVEHPPPFLGDRWSESGWALILDAVLEAEEAVAAAVRRGEDRTEATG